MKKLLAILLALCMLLSLTACAETEVQEEEREAEVEFEESDEEKSLSFIDPATLSSGADQEEAEEEEPAEEAGEDAEEQPAEETPAEAPAPEAPESGTIAVPEFTPSGAIPSAFESTTLLDDEYCTVSLVGYNPDGSWGAELQLELTNKCDHELMFAARETAANGIMIDPSWACSVDAGDTATSKLTFDEEEMEYRGINYLQELVLSFDIYNNEDWGADHYFEGAFNILLPAAGSGAPNSAMETDFPGYVVVDNTDITIAIVDYNEEGYWGPELKVLLVNKTDEGIWVSQDGSAINGVMIYGSFGEEVLPGAIAYVPFSWDEENLDAAGILYPKDIRVVFDACTSVDYDDIFYGEISFTLEGGSGPVVEEVSYDGFEEAVLLEGNGISIVAKYFDMEGYWGPTVTLYLKNETNKTVYFNLDAAWVNGVELNPYWGTTLLSHTVRYVEIDWDEDDFADAGITDVETIKFSFMAQDCENWNDLAEGEATLFLH